MILKEQVQHFTGGKVVAVRGNSKADIHRIKDHEVTDFMSWGKPFADMLRQLQHKDPFHAARHLPDQRG